MHIAVILVAIPSHMSPFPPLPSRPLLQYENQANIHGSWGTAGLIVPEYSDAEGKVSNESISHEVIPSCLCMYVALFCFAYSHCVHVNSLAYQKRISKCQMDGLGRENGVSESGELLVDYACIQHMSQHNYSKV